MPIAEYGLRIAIAVVRNRTVEQRVWIGECPNSVRPGWDCYSSIDEFASTNPSADRVIVNDPSATLREDDWLKLYAIAPLARIVRRVGPWRAGIERTDPQWPAASTVVTDSVEELLVHQEQGQLPWTAAYDERATSGRDVQLDGLTVHVAIGDTELRAMWEESIQESGGILVSASSPETLESGEPEMPLFELCVLDRAGDWEANWTIRLVPDPWNIVPFEKQITASVLDSPRLVLSRYLHQRSAGR